MLSARLGFARGRVTPREAARQDVQGDVDVEGAGMSRYVIDAPTLLYVVANGVPVSPAHQLVAPNVIRSQALASLLTAVRRGDLDESLALRQHERLTELKMRLLGDRMSRRTAWNIARDQGWDTLDEADYIAVTRLQADALVTVNPALAAKAAGLVRLAPFEALSRVDD